MLNTSAKRKASTKDLRKQKVTSLNCKLNIKQDTKVQNDLKQNSNNQSIKKQIATKTNLVKQNQRKCYSNHYRKTTKMGDLCGKTQMSQSASAMSIKQPEQRTEPNKESLKDKKKETDEKDDLKILPIAKKEPEISDANNNNTGAVKILVNDITPSNSFNSQEFLLLQRQSNSTRSSQTTSPIHKRALLQSRSTSNINNLEDSPNQPFTKEKLIKNHRKFNFNLNKSKQDENSSTSTRVCSCTANNQLNLNKYKTRRRKSWSFTSNDIPSINITFFDQIVQERKQISHTDQKLANESKDFKDDLDQISTQLEDWYVF